VFWIGSKKKGYDCCLEITPEIVSDAWITVELYNSNGEFDEKVYELWVWWWCKIGLIFNDDGSFTYTLRFSRKRFMSTKDKYPFRDSPRKSKIVDVAHI